MRRASKGVSAPGSPPTPPRHRVFTRRTDTGNSASWRRREARPATGSVFFASNSVADGQLPVMQRIVPDCVAVVEHSGPGFRDGIRPEEALALGQVVERRYREFATGRDC